MITAAEANAQAKESVETDFEDRLEQVMKNIQWAISFGRMKIQEYMPSQLMREEIAKYLEKLGFLISYPKSDDSLKYENDGCYMYIYWG
jgi:ribosomal protein S8